MSTLAAELQEVAAELIAEEGRTVTLRQEAKATLVDANKPWLGFESSATETPIAAALFTPDTLVNSGVRFAAGSSLSEMDVVAYVAGDALSGDIAVGDAIDDTDGSTWHVADVDETKPGTVRTHWVLGLKQGAGS